jgi:YVTN family beta-propeller protein
MIRAGLGVFAAVMLLHPDGARVLQTNSAGDNIHVIDPATNQAVGTIEDIEVPHGVAIAPGGKAIYVTDES